MEGVNRMKILVTGGAGFIGSHVVERLLRLSHRVTVIDDLDDFYDPELKRENLAAARRLAPFEFHQSDICDVNSVSEIVRTGQYDAVIHLAARAGVRPSIQEPLLYEKVNVYGTMALLEACREAQVRKFIFASSSSVYGISNHVPFAEEDRLLPISPYAATKIAGEKICYTYSHLYRLPVVCLRFFTVYGPRQRPDLAIHKFTKLIDQGQPIPVFGDGLSGRDYTYIDDIVEGVIRCLEYDCCYEIINLGNSHPVALTDMIASIENALGKKAECCWLRHQPGDVPITYADISKAERVLGYRPQTPLQEGVNQFAKWYSTSVGSPRRCSTLPGCRSTSARLS
jgi:UDP-glucuronate 4-epimerase